MKSVLQYFSKDLDALCAGACGNKSLSHVLKGEQRQPEESADRVEVLLSDGVDKALDHAKVSSSVNTTCCNSLKSILCREC